MTRYETLLLAIPEITKEELSSLEKQVEQILKKSNSTLLSFERWGKYRLAYPVRKNDYGVYCLIRFEMPEKSAQTVKDLDALFAFKHGDIVMRTMNTQLDPRRPLTYQRPESLEDAPVRDVDSFIRENNMTGLLSATSTAATASDEGEFSEEEN